MERERKYFYQEISKFCLLFVDPVGVQAALDQAQSLHGSPDGGPESGDVTRGAGGQQRGGQVDPEVVHTVQDPVPRLGRVNSLVPDRFLVDLLVSFVPVLKIYRKYSLINLIK